MKRTTRIPALIAVLVMAIATLAHGASAQSREERAIRAAGDAWQRYIREQKVDSIVDLFTSDAVFMLANSPPTRGSAALRAGWAEMVKTPGLELSWKPDRIEVTSPTRATEYGTYTESYDTPNGKGRDSGSYVTIWHKVNGKWKVAMDAPVSSMPAAAAAPGTSDISDAQRAAIADSVRQVTRQFIAAASRVDPEATFAFFSRSPDFAAADNGTLYTSLDRLRDVYTGVYKGLQSNDMQFGESRLSVLSPTSVVETLTGTFAPVDRAGVKAAPRGFNLTLLWVREPGGWRILQIHQSFLPMTR